MQKLSMQFDGFLYIHISMLHQASQESEYFQHPRRLSHVLPLRLLLRIFKLKNNGCQLILPASVEIDSCSINEKIV